MTPDLPMARAPRQAAQLLLVLPEGHTLLTLPSGEGRMLGYWRFGAAIVAVVLGFVLYMNFVPRTASFGMQAEAGGSGMLRLTLSFAATIAGVVLGSVYRQIRELQARGAVRIDDFGAFFGDVFRSTDMWLGLVGSPLVYALLLKSSDGMSLPGLITVALENGFCCLLIISGFVGKTEQQASPKLG
jgi:hypothetical protein